MRGNGHAVPPHRAGPRVSRSASPRSKGRSRWTHADTRHRAHAAGARPRRTRSGATSRPTRWSARWSSRERRHRRAGWYEGPRARRTPRFAALAEAGDRARGATIVLHPGALRPSRSHPAVHRRPDRRRRRARRRRRHRPEPARATAGASPVSRARASRSIDGVLAEAAPSAERGLRAARHAPGSRSSSGRWPPRSTARRPRTTAPPAGSRRRRRAPTRIASRRGRTRSSSAPAPCSPTTRRSPCARSGARRRVAAAPRRRGRDRPTVRRAAVFDGGAPTLSPPPSGRRRRASRAGQAAGAEVDRARPAESGGVSPTALMAHARQARRPRRAARGRRDARLELPARATSSTGSCSTSRPAGRRRRRARRRRRCGFAPIDAARQAATSDGSTASDRICGWRPMFTGIVEERGAVLVPGGWAPGRSPAASS